MPRQRKKDTTKKPLDVKVSTKKQIAKAITSSTSPKKSTKGIGQTFDSLI